MNRAGSSGSALFLCTDIPMRRVWVFAVAMAMASCRAGGTDPATGPGSPRVSGDPRMTGASAQQPWFTDVTESSGLRMTHFNGMAGDFLYPEVMPPGVALFDYDNDGDLDVFVPQGTMLGSKTIAQALAKPEEPLHGRLFRNDLAGGEVRFTDV